MNLLEKQLSTVYFKDVRFLWVTLYIFDYYRFGTTSSISTYVFKKDQELVKKLFMLYVLQVVLLSELLLLW